jgi:hypothetical protein
MDRLLQLAAFVQRDGPGCQYETAKGITFALEQAEAACVL